MRFLKYSAAAVSTAVVSFPAFAVPSPVADMTTAMDLPTIKTDIVALVTSNIGIAMVILAGIVAFGLLRRFTAGR
jgi:hypothetical protein